MGLFSFLNKGNKTPKNLSSLNAACKYLKSQQPKNKSQAILHLSYASRMYLEFLYAQYKRIELVQWKYGLVKLTTPQIEELENYVWALAQKSAPQTGISYLDLFELLMLPDKANTMHLMPTYGSMFFTYAQSLIIGSESDTQTKSIESTVLKILNSHDTNYDHLLQYQRGGHFSYTSKDAFNENEVIGELEKEIIFASHNSGLSNCFRAYADQEQACDAICLRRLEAPMIFFNNKEKEDRLPTLGVEAFLSGLIYTQTHYGRIDADTFHAAIDYMNTIDSDIMIKTAEEISKVENIPGNGKKINEAVGSIVETCISYLNNNKSSNQEINDMFVDCYLKAMFMFGTGLYFKP